MKKVLVILLVSFLGMSAVQAQKFAYVDSQYILDNIPEYKAAQNQLDALSKKWQEEIETKIAEVDKLYKAYQTDKVLMPEDLKQRKEEEIMQKEREVKELQKKRFGNKGDLFKKREELVKPIQDKIFNAIEAFAKERGYAIVFDKAGGLTMLYTDAKFDKSDDVLRKLGYQPGTTGGDSKSQSRPGRR